MRLLVCCNSLVVLPLARAVMAPATLSASQKQAMCLGLYRLEKLEVFRVAGTCVEMVMVVAPIDFASPTRFFKANARLPIG